MNDTRDRRWLLKNTLSSGPLCAAGTSLISSLVGCAPARRSKNEPAANEILEWTASEAIQHIRNGSITAERYTSQLLQRYRESKTLNAMTWIDESRVLENARSVDKARSQGQQLGLLAGLPLVVKDNINTVGFPTSAGTPSLKGFYPTTDAPVADILFKSGAILLGKTNMHELAYGITSSNPTFGFAQNPYDTSRVPGGSSGGTAAAIAAVHTSGSGHRYRRFDTDSRRVLRNCGFPPLPEERVKRGPTTA